MVTVNLQKAILPSLEELVLHSNYGLSWHTFLTLLFSQESDPRSSSGTAKLDRGAEHDTVTAYKKVRRLVIPNLDDISTILGNPRFLEVEILGLTECTLNDKSVDFFPDMAPKLRRLDLSKTSINGVGIKHLVQVYKGQLEWLGLDHCQQLGADAVEWARSQGVQVSHRMTGIEEKGSRVRYRH